MTLTLVRCLRCNMEFKIIHQNAVKHNRLKRTHCQHCIQDRYHNMTGTRIWRIWLGMKARATNPSDKNYGGRGISLCREWFEFENFYKDMSPGYSDNLTIERVDVNKPYNKDNCTWITMFNQQGNKRPTRRVVYQGEEIHLAELCRRSGFSKMMLTSRLNLGMTGDQAVADASTSPYGKSQNPKNISRREKRKCTTS